MKPRLLLSWPLSFLLLTGLAGTSGQAAQNPEKQEQQEDLRRLQEESADYFRKWLSEDVVYIITDEERAVFQDLSTNEEREQFIEQFWQRRDPDLRTAYNEFREEHYRRIAYANEKFVSAQPGWKTDRGKIYIIHGPPDEVEARPTGGAYVRPMREGGGTTSAHPFEIWRYRNIDGLGRNVELEFVDPTYTEEFRLARNPWDKDALLYVPGAGMTLAEEMGLATKEQRPALHPGSSDSRERYPLMAEFARAEDNPFIRWENYNLVQKPPELKYQDLKEIVEVNINFNNLPFSVRPDYFQLSEERVLVPVTISFQNQNLTYKKEGPVQIARVAVYGMVTSMTNRVITEFEHDVISSHTQEQLEQGLQRLSMYQKVLPLDRRMRYKLDLVIKDLNSDNVGVKRIALIPPATPKNEELSVSSLLLSDSVRTLESIPEVNEMFVLGNVQLRPYLDKTFHRDHRLAIYLQVYGAGFDQTTLQPSLRIVYRVRRGDEQAAEWVDEAGASIQHFSNQRVVLIANLPIQDLEAGDYGLEVEVQDRLTGKTVTAQDRFKLLGARPVARTQ